MPAEDDDIVFESREVYHGPVSPSPEEAKAVNKYRKLLHIFRSHHKDEKFKIQDETAKNKPKKDKDKKKNRRAKRMENPDERKEMFQKKMENSWVELPNTLKGKKVKISHERLSEYHDDGSDEQNSIKSESTTHFVNRTKNPLKNGFPDISAYLRNSPNGFRNTCELFRDHESSGGSSSEKSEKSVETEKSEHFSSQSVIIETHPIIHYHENDESEDSIMRIDQVISNGSGFQQVNESFELKSERKRANDSNSSDSVINDSSVSSSSSDTSHQDDSGTEISDAAKKAFKDMVSDFEKICTKNSKLDHDVKSIGKKEKEDAKQSKEISAAIEEARPYSDVLFDAVPNNEGVFVNEEFGENKEPPKSGIVYQEVTFDKEKSTEIYDEIANKDNSKHIYQEPDQSEEDAQQQEFPKSHLNEEEKAKKQSAQAIAKELSSQIFAKKGKHQNPKTFDKHRENFLKSLGYDVSIMKTDGSVVDSVKKTALALDPPAEMVENFYCVSNLLDGRIPENPDEELKEEQDSQFSGNLQYFSVAEWRTAVAMGNKRGVASIAMETIVEEPESDTATKLSVREILRRFEELGSKHFNEKLFLSEEEKTATLKQIHETLKCLEEKVRMFETKNDPNQQQQQQQHEASRVSRSPDGWRGAAPVHRPLQMAKHQQEPDEESMPATINDGKHSLLQFAMHHFRASPEKFEMLKASDGSISGSLKVIESKNKKNKGGGSSGGKDQNEWTWKEQVDLVKFTPTPVEFSLLRLDSPELSDLAVECFVCLMRYMGDLPMPTDVSEVKCVYTVLMHCHKFEQLRDEVYCQLMKQTTNNKSAQPESCQRGWRLFSIVAAYFTSSDTLKPFLFKYLETAAYDKRRAYHGTATVCLQNLRKTFKYGGRKNVPSVEEITAISAGRNSKRQIYRLPGGTEKVVNTKSTTVVQDVIEELCVMINVDTPVEMEEFSVYCIVEGDTFTMPLAKEEYILDVTTELHKNHQVFYLIFCRSVWFFPLRLDSQLYVEVVFNQIAPDYLEGLLLVMPGENLDQDIIYDIARVAALLHRAADMAYLPSMKETKFLLPKPALGVRDVKPTQWVNMVQSNWPECEELTTIQAKAQVLDTLSKWPLFGSSFFAVKRSSEPKERADHILALNRSGVHFIDLITHETILHYPFSEVISTRKVKSEDGTLFLDMKCGNLMQQRITRLQTDQAHEISRLIRQYITLQQRMVPGGQQ